MTKVSFNGHEFSIENALHEKLLLMIQRTNLYNNENFIIIDGRNGTGKTRLAGLLCGAYAGMSGRKYTVDNIFFDTDSLIKFAINNKEQIIHFDEALFSAMASDWQTREQKRLIKMLLLARKKKHFYVFCIPDFFSLKSTIAVDKAIALLHTYLEDGIKPGTFTYYNQDAKDSMWQNYKRAGFKGYKKYYTLKGRFSNVFPKIVDEDAYEAKKDAAILTIGDDEVKVDKSLAKLLTLQQKIPLLTEKFKITQTELAEFFDIDRKTLYRWSKSGSESHSTREKHLFGALSAVSLDKTGADQENFDVEVSEEDYLGEEQLIATQ